MSTIQLSLLHWCTNQARALATRKVEICEDLIKRGVDTMPDEYHDLVAQDKQLTEIYEFAVKQAQRWGQA